MIVRNKLQMYSLLNSGAFGNTVPQHFSLEEWHAASGPSYPFWGIRSLTPGGPCRLNCQAAEVEETVHRFARQGYKTNITCMISSVGRVTLLGEAYDSDTGLCFYGHEYVEPVHDWRTLMRRPVAYHGVAARMVLARHLNARSMEDLRDLISIYPGHVYEFSALDRCYGTVPGRNAIVWEVRQY